MRRSINCISYHVYEAARTWRVEIDNEDVSREFSTFKNACNAAREAAEARWLLTGNTTCVRLGRPGSASALDARFG